MAKGWKLSDQTRKRMRAARLGRKLSPATRAKISAKSRAFWDRVKRLEADAEASANAQ
jgi:hypothetical protein